MARKPYTRPRLVKYGHVSDIVQGNGGQRRDFIGRNSKVTCWIAEVLYGVNDPRTLLLRAFLTSIYESRRSGWTLVWLYRELGPATAALISLHVFPRAPFQRLFDALLDGALAETAEVLVASRRR